MSDLRSKFVAERWSWSAIPAWMIPSLLVPVILALALVAYVLIEAAS